MQESMLFVPMATRVNFWARKLTSFVAFEPEHPERVRPVLVALGHEALRGAVERLVPARGAELARVADERLGEAGVLHRHLSSPAVVPGIASQAVGRGRTRTVAL